MLEMVPTFRNLDKVLYRMGLLSVEESLATRITWWPLISILGTFSSGKSTFINHYVGEKLQSTGNQAVDDKFTVICFGPGENHRALPGAALDADPRFPFYRMSAEIDKVATGEGRRIDAYLQLKTVASPHMKGKIVIDSPGFDADDQRTSILRLTDHIIDLSDVVLVLFDARHPEPGAMHDTLEHLVQRTIHRPDANKFMFILNQIDTTAREDNPEEVVGAWQRAVAQAGLTSGRFFCIYNEEASVPIEDPALRARFRAKRDADLKLIHSRIADVEVERGYRIMSMLNAVANELEQDIAPALERVLERWQSRVNWGSLGLAVLAALVVGGGLIMAGGEALGAALTWFKGHPYGAAAAVVAVVAMLFAGNLWVRHIAARSLAPQVPEKIGQGDLNLRQAFLKNTTFYRGVFNSNPVGWGAATKRRLQEIRDDAARHIQRLNDLYTDPSGRRTWLAKPDGAKPDGATAEPEAPEESRPRES